MLNAWQIYEIDTWPPSFIREKDSFQCLFSMVTVCRSVQTDKIRVVVVILIRDEAWFDTVAPGESLLWNVEEFLVAFSVIPANGPDQKTSEGGW